MIKKWLVPIIIGIILAVILLFLFPTLRGNKSFFISKTLFNSEPLSYNYAVKSAAPSVVNIYSYSFDENSNDKSVVPLGSGVIMSHDGYIITNFHVINHSNQIIIALQNGQIYEAALIGFDKLVDLAVIKIDAKNLSSIPLNLDRKIKVGDVVLAIGNPYNLGQTITQGIISATGRDGMSEYKRQNFIQTDASINKGNSGGALVNTLGELVGINTLSFAKSDMHEIPEGIGFAIPATLAIKIMNKLIKNGTIIRGYIGIDGIEFKPHNYQNEQLASIGILVTNTEGPAKKAGIKPHDIILEINNKPVKSIIDVMDQVAEFKPSEIVTVTLLRDGKKISLPVKIEQLLLS